MPKRALSGAVILGYVYNGAVWEASAFGYGGLAYGQEPLEPPSDGAIADESGARSDTSPGTVP